MKKLFVFGLSIAMIAGAASCKKSSKGKLSNAWTVTSMEMTTTTTNNSGDVDVETVSATETAVTVTSTSTPSGGTASTSTISGTITENTYTIEKDGTWSSTLNATLTQTETGYTVTQTIVQTNSGTWDFLGGVGEFKKNERVVFNTLSSTESNSTTVAITGGSSSTDASSSTNSYAEGENSMVYLIVESKGKELQLSSEENNTSVYTSTPAGGTASTSTDKTVGSSSMTMVQK